MSPTPAETARAGHISAPRLDPYLRETGGDLGRALALYEWNVYASGAVYEVLHRFEVGLRNAMDPRLCAWNATQTNPTTGAPHGSDWLIDPSPLLQRLARKAISDATPLARKAVNRGPARRSMRHADVLAATSLGTWRYLLPDADLGRQLLWREALQDAFPHLPPHTEGGFVTGKVKTVLFLRNRVAHLEPLLNVSRTQAQVGNAYEVASWIDPYLSTWLTSKSRVPQVLKARLSL